MSGDPQNFRISCGNPAETPGTPRKPRGNPRGNPAETPRKHPRKPRRTSTKTPERTPWNSTRRSVASVNYLRSLSPSLPTRLCKQEGDSKRKPCEPQLSLMSRTTLRVRAAHWSWVSFHGKPSSFATRKLARSQETVVSCKGASSKSGACFFTLGRQYKRKPAFATASSCSRTTLPPGEFTQAPSSVKSVLAK